MATKSNTVSKLSDDALIALAVEVHAEAQRRGIESQVRVWTVSLGDEEKTRIAEESARREKARLDHEEALEIARKAAAKVRLEKENAAREAEVAKVAKLWADKERIGTRVKEILGTSIEVPFEDKELRKKISACEGRLQHIRTQQGKWYLKGYTLTFGSEEAALEYRQRDLITRDIEVKQYDHSSEIASLEAEIPALKAELASAPKTIRKRQTYRLEVWSRDADVRVYIARSEAGFGESLFDYFHTGNRNQAPGTSLVIWEQLEQAAATLGVSRESISQELKALSAELCDRYTSLKIETC